MPCSHSTWERAICEWRQLRTGGRACGDGPHRSWGKHRGWRRRKQNKEYNLVASRETMHLFVCFFLYSFSSPNSGPLPGTDVRRSVCRDGRHAGVYVCYFRSAMTNQTLAIKNKKKGRGGESHPSPSIKRLSADLSRGPQPGPWWACGGGSVDLWAIKAAGAAQAVTLLFKSPRVIVAWCSATQSVCYLESFFVVVVVLFSRRRK